MGRDRTGAAFGSENGATTWAAGSASAARDPRSDFFECRICYILNGLTAAWVAKISLRKES
jgi:hypothetical protein